MKASLRTRAGSLPRAGLAAIVLVVVLAGCSGPTGILIEVTSNDLEVPEDIDALRFEVETDEGPMASETFELQSDWEHSLGIRPGAASNDAAVTITIYGMKDGDDVIRHIIQTNFIPGVEVVFTVELQRDCLGVFCPEMQNCSGGRCRFGSDAGMDAGTDAATDSGVDAGMDAGRDAGTDAGMDAAMDAGADAGMDSGADAGMDAGADVGVDSGTDAGMRTDAGPPGPIVINEVDYDQPGTDTDEFIELFNPSSSTTSLEGLAVVLVNGADNGEYDRIELSGTLAAGAYLVIGSGTVTVPGDATKVEFSSADHNVQNGAPDGIALLDTSSGELLDALSYEGSITAATISGVAGTVDLVEGTATSAEDDNDDDPNRSLVRLPNGRDTDDAATDWTSTAPPTPGTENM